uniref:Uncharacterized protein n=1 Tax=Anguilla anguilla TaxID=7936 RepID=A0A0E9XY70_ANGAN
MSAQAQVTSLGNLSWY